MVVLPCLNLDETMRYFIDKVGFRLEMITPADNPRSAVLTGHGIRLCLDTEFSGDGGLLRLNSTDGVSTKVVAPNGTVIEFRPIHPIPIYNDVYNDAVYNDLDRTPSLNRFSGDASWTIGRAGMRYRDLIPGRLGGRAIASHIHIPSGGPVPDYVHFHRIEFQMIYCRSGWVRVVYEDQGESFVMHAGDCVLQPPEIRHRVIESSDDLEVIEVSVPAEHETFAEHEITLPNKTFKPDRIFGGQRFVRHIAEETSWTNLSEHVQSQDTGIAKATDHKFSTKMVRSTKSAESIQMANIGNTTFIYVLSGTLDLLSESSQTSLAQDDCILIPSITKLEAKLNGKILQVELTLVR